MRRRLIGDKWSLSALSVNPTATPKCSVPVRDCHTVLCPPRSRHGNRQNQASAIDCSISATTSSISLAISASEACAASNRVEAGDICPLVILANAGMAPIPKAKTAKSLGIDLVLSTTRGFVTHAGVDPARRAELEAGITEAMKHSLYQAYLANSGLDDDLAAALGPMGRADQGHGRRVRPGA